MPLPFRSYSNVKVFLSSWPSTCRLIRFLNYLAGMYRFIKPWNRDIVTSWVDRIKLLAISGDSSHVEDIDPDALSAMRESQAILRQKFDDYEQEKAQMHKQMQQQASSILHFQAYCQSLVSKIY